MRMGRADKISLLNMLLKGEANINQINTPSVGPVLIETSKDVYQCMTTARTLSKAEFEHENEGNEHITFILPDNGRDKS